jgi:hypothetical protein
MATRKRKPRATSSRKRTPATKPRRSTPTRRPPSRKPRAARARARTVSLVTERVANALGGFTEATLGAVGGAVGRRQFHARGAAVGRRGGDVRGRSGRHRVEERDAGGAPSVAEGCPQERLIRAPADVWRDDPARETEADVFNQVLVLVRPEGVEIVGEEYPESSGPALLWPCSGTTLSSRRPPS